jgi:hypothetical protein
MKQPTDEERASITRAALMAACGENTGEKTAEAKAELAEESPPIPVGSPIIYLTSKTA